MAWIAADENSGAWIYTDKPVRDKVGKFWRANNPSLAIGKASCIHLIGRLPSWLDEPVEIGEVKTIEGTTALTEIESDDRAEFWKQCVLNALIAPCDLKDGGVVGFADRMLEEYDKRFRQQ